MTYNPSPHSRTMCLIGGMICLNFTKGGLRRGASQGGLEGGLEKGLEGGLEKDLLEGGFKGSPKPLTGAQRGLEKELQGGFETSKAPSFLKLEGEGLKERGA